MRYGTGRTWRAACRISHVILLVALASAVSSRAAWRPDLFQVYCGKAYPETKPPEGFVAAMQYRFYLDHLGDEIDQPAEQGCLSPELSRQLAGYASEALHAYERMGFRSPAPNRLGPVVRDENGREVVRIYADPMTTVAYADTLAVQAKERPTLPDSLALVRLNPKAFASRPPPFDYRMLVHEIFHVVQHAQPFVNQPQTAGLPAAWIWEATADAMSVKLMQAHFGKHGYEPPLSVKGSRSVYELRPYDRSLTWESTEARDEYGNALVPHYTASSFWTYLAERYFHGELSYLAKWFAKPEDEANADDWLRWLDERLRSGDGGVGHPLYLIFPDFIAHYAEWGSKKYPNIGDRNWLKQAFGGCQEVDLSPESAKGSEERSIADLHFELEPLSAKCIRLRVSGLSQGDVGTIQWMAYDSTVDRLDNIHLTASRLGGHLAATGESYDCYDATRGDRSELCIDKPFTGTRGPESGDRLGDAGAVSSHGGDFVKTWRGEPQTAVNGAFEDLFFVVHSPVHPSDFKHDIRIHPGRQKIHVQVGLEWNRLRTSESGRQHDVASGVDTIATQGLVPMRGGEGDLKKQLMDRMRGMMGDPDEMSKLMFQMNAANGTTLDQSPGISMLNLTRGDSASSTGSETANTSFSFIVDPAIPFQGAGTYPAGLIGATGGDVSGEMVVDASGEPSSRIRVLRFDDDVLHLDLDGRYCRYRDYDFVSEHCRKPQTFQAEVLKPFGWAYDSKRTFRSIDTPGMKEYRDYLKESLGEFASGTSPKKVSGGAASGAASGASSDGTGGRTCDCSCEAAERLEKAREKYNAAGDAAVKAGKTPPMPPPALMTAMRCAMQCGEAWQACGE